MRNAPIDVVNKSPSQLLNSRCLRSRIPPNNEQLQPQICTNVLPLLKERQKRQKSQFDKHTREATPLNVGDNVRVHNGSQWIRARVTRKDTCPRSYWIRTENGGIWRRNRKHLRTTREDFENWSWDEETTQDREGESGQAERDERERQTVTKSHEEDTG
uniref:Uncharacterized protein n=1 Tax=Strigamia maritima TaxID=126957 RepID=T1IYP8_STRMM